MAKTGQDAKPYLKRNGQWTVDGLSNATTETPQLNGALLAKHAGKKAMIHISTVLSALGTNTLLLSSFNLAMMLYLYDQFPRGCKMMLETSGNGTDICSREFNIVKNGLDPAGVFPYISSLIEQNNRLVSKLKHLDPLAMFGENGTVEADNEAESIKAETEGKESAQVAFAPAEAEEKAKREAERIIADAEKRARDKDGNNALMEILANSPDIVLLDIGYPFLNELELGKKICRNFPGTGVVILSVNPRDDDDELFEAIRTGPVAYLRTRHCLDAEVIETIRRATSREYPINDAVISRLKVAKRVLRRFHEMSCMGRTMEEVTAHLTPREV